MKSQVFLALALTAAVVCAAAQPGAPSNAAAVVERFTAEYLPWEPDTRVTARPNPSEDLAGLQAYDIERKGKYEKLDVKMTDFVSADGKWIFTGSVVRNAVDPKKTRPIESDRDLVGVSGYFSKIFRSSAAATLEPAGDKAGLKGVNVLLDTGYFSQPLHEFVSADGSGLFVGQLWKLNESVAAQRKAIMNLSEAPSIGSSQPRVTIVEYADMECPFCKKRGLQMDQLMEQYGKKLDIRRYYKYYPLWVNHVWSMKAASAAVCLSRVSPDLVFPFKKLCYDHQETLTVAGIDEQAFNFVDANNIPRGDFLGCYLRESSFSAIRSDMEEGGRLGVISTPTYLVNGVEIYWVPDDVMEEYLKVLLKGKK